MNDTEYIVYQNATGKIGRLRSLNGSDITPLSLWERLCFLFGF